MGCLRLKELLQYEVPRYVERCRNMGVPLNVVTPENYKWAAEIKAEYCSTCEDRGGCGIEDRISDVA